MVRSRSRIKTIMENQQLRKRHQKPSAKTSSDSLYSSKKLAYKLSEAEVISSALFGMEIEPSTPTEDLGQLDTLTHILV